MKTEDFNYELPPERIAHTPSKERQMSRLMIVPKHTNEQQHEVFSSLPNYLREGDLLVMNNTKVLPARCYGQKETGGKVEFLFLEPNDGLPFTESKQWKCMLKGKRIREGSTLILDEERSLVVDKKLDRGLHYVSLVGFENMLDYLEQHGKMPLPPYISSEQEELFHQDRYQTVFAKESGAVAAPTAGLHFTDELLAEIQAKGVQLAYVTLHVGMGTFLPVEVSDILEHKMHKEQFYVSEETKAAIQATKDRGNRVISVGTTSLRALEGSVQEQEIRTGWQETEIFIYPGYQFQVIDGLITNFHLPKSTLLMLVSALVGKERILQAYQEAIDQEYRFFSYGDAMFCMPE